MYLNLHSDPYDGVNDAVWRRAREFAAECVTPFASTWEATGEYPVEAVKAAVKEFGRTLIPKDHGGMGQSVSTLLRVLEEFGRADIGFALAFVVPLNVALTLTLSANKSLVDSSLKQLLTGDKLGAFCLTEASGGSDAAAVTTSASQSDTGAYRISGRKVWIMNATVVDTFVVFARFGDEGVGAFLVDGSKPGIARGERYRLLGGNVTHCADVTFENVPAESSDILFPAGTGFKAAMRALDVARLGIAAIANGALWGALEYSLGYASDRELFKSKLLEKQGIQWKFADALSDLEASRLMTFRAAALTQKGGGSTVMTAHAKKFANRAAANGIGKAVRLMGAAGTRFDHPVARQLAANELLFNTDGTVEIMDLIIGRSLSSP